jgi:hypothetical protein
LRTGPSRPSPTAAPSRRWLRRAGERPSP